MMLRSPILSSARLSPYTQRIATVVSELPKYVNAPDTKTTVLENGFRVCSENTGGNLASVGVYIDTGSAVENEKNNGVAHFLEHLAFKGTTKRSGRDIEVLMENMGGHLNAYTARELTAYYAQVLKKDASTAVDILADILLNSTHTDAAIDAERGVILSEMESVEKDLQESVFDHLHSVAFQGTPYGFPILGSVANVRALTRADLRAFIDTHYTAPRMVLCAAGAVDHAELCRAAERAFGGLSAANKHPRGPDRHAAVLVSAQHTEYTGGMVLVRDDALPGVHAAVAMEGCRWSDPNFFAFLVMQALVGDYDRLAGKASHSASRLAEVFGEERLGSKFMSFNTAYHDTGLFGAYVVTDRKHASDAIFEVQNEWMRIAHAATDFEVERAKAQLKGKLLMGVNGSVGVMEEMGRQMVTLGRRMGVKEMLSRLEAVNAAKVREVAYEYLYDNDPVCAAVGDVDAGYFPDYNILQKGALWYRA